MSSNRGSGESDGMVKICLPGTAGPKKKWDPTTNSTVDLLGEKEFTSSHTISCATVFTDNSPPPLKTLIWGKFSEDPKKPPTHPQHGEQLDPTDGDGGGRVLGSDPERRADSSPGNPRTEGRGGIEEKNLWWKEKQHAPCIRHCYPFGRNVLKPSSQKNDTCVFHNARSSTRFRLLWS